MELKPDHWSADDFMDFISKLPGEEITIDVDFRPVVYLAPTQARGKVGDAFRLGGYKVVEMRVLPMEEASEDAPDEL